MGEQASATVHGRGPYGARSLARSLARNAGGTMRDLGRSNDDLHARAKGLRMESKIKRPATN